MFTSYVMCVTIISDICICITDSYFRLKGQTPSLHTCFDASNFCKSQRIRHSQVPVQRDATEEGNADVDVGVEDEAEQLAALWPVDPVIMLQEVVDPERQSGNVQEVSHRQVDQIDAKLVVLAYLEGGMQWQVM